MNRRDALKIAALFAASGVIADTVPIKSQNSKKRALLVIDVQNEYFTGLLPVTYPHNSTSNIVTAIQAANNAHISIVMVQHTSKAKAFVKGTHGWELHESVKNAKTAHTIEKTMASSFVGTDLEEWLRKNDIDTVVISGYMTQHCCDTTARYAHHLGFNVEFLSDATGTLAFENKAGKATAEELHRATLVEQAFRFSNIMSTREWIEAIRV
ncbi:MAG TPA: isochorismatase [Sulfuricurvum kujiense]|uniref:Isochorismatase n=1 Tax=Sulfuricurvum kujiense TaxID=148813 RepID=A0A2D3WCW0_9BACT|nr:MULTISPECIES: cysteine hydrolase family protein [Sulfuricurvum]DAB37735.1 MAG TPA: isochorismatase [Sulfuricurvum kujiense]